VNNIAVFLVFILFFKRFLKTSVCFLVLLTVAFELIFIFPSNARTLALMSIGDATDYPSSH
jgi:hypothetical protein